MNNYSKFDELFDLEELKQEIEEASSSNVERKEVPFGDYEVKVTKLELGEFGFEGDDYGKPVINIWFKIINHPEYNGQMLFCTKKLFAKNPQYNGLMIKNAIDFLETLESGIPVAFGESFADFGQCIENIFKAIDGREEYQLAYTEKENKGYTFKEYNIVQKF